MPGFDPDTYHWQKHGERFDKLSDGEWAGVWKHVRFASRREPLADEARVRALVDDAAISSGWFVDGGGDLHISRAEYRRFTTEDRRFQEGSSNVAGNGSFFRSPAL